MTISAKGLKRLVKVHVKLREHHTAKLAKLQEELLEIERSEKELIETFDRLSNLAALSPLGFNRRVNALRARAMAVNKTIDETRDKLAKVMTAENWLKEERVRVGEAEDLAETQESLDEWVEGRLLDVSLPQGSESTLDMIEDERVLKRSGQ